jgi:protein tyrosine/serine phosphatase
MVRPMFRAGCTIWIVLLACAIVAHGGPDTATKLEVAGLPNLARINANVYRCAQPTAEGLRAAEKLGIKTVINLRGFHSDKSLLKLTGLKAEHIRFNTWNAEDEDVVQFLKIISNTNAGPFLIHCQHGADRTGTMVAMYRMAVQGWTKDAAIKEMTTGGYGYHRVWSNLIRYLKSVDVAVLCRKAKIGDTLIATQSEPAETQLAAPLAK